MYLYIRGKLNKLLKHRIGQYLAEIQPFANQNIEKIGFKVVKMKSLSVLITNKKIGFEIYGRNLQNIFKYHTHTHTHTHVGFYGLRGLSIGVMVFILYKLYVLLPYTLHLHLALTGDGAFLLSLKKTHSVWFISIFNYGDTENVLINHLLLVIPMSYPCHYTNLCPHKPHKHAHTHTHTHTHKYIYIYI